MSNPRHIAIIMDGNGRWAKARGLPRTAGHKAGVDALRETIRAAGKMGIPYLTLFAFSSENWSRPRSEVSDLMGLLKLFIRRDLADLHRENVRVRIIGEREGLAKDIRALLTEAESLTEKNTALTLIIAFNYGSRNEITRAVKALLSDGDRIEAETRLAYAAEPGRQHHRARITHACGLGLGQVDGWQGRACHSRVGSRPQSDHRRQQSAHSLAGTQ